MTDQRLLVRQSQPTRAGAAGNDQRTRTDLAGIAALRANGRRLEVGRRDVSR